MIEVKLPKELQTRLELVAKVTNRSKSYYMLEALKQYLDVRADYLVAIATIEENNPRYSYDEVRRELGLED